MRNCKIVSVANQKGGTGKTTTASNMGNALAHEGKKVLLADLDPQANLSMSFGIEHPDELPISMHNVLSMVMEADSSLNDTEYIIRGKKLDIMEYCLPYVMNELIFLKMQKNCLMIFVKTE